MDYGCYYITEKGDIPRNAEWLVFDMDGTLTPESLDYLAGFFGLEKEIAEITELGMQGKIRFEDSVRQRLGIMKGMHREKVIMAGYEMPLQQGALELIRELGYVTAIITGGFSDIAYTVARRLGADVYWANELVYDNNRTTEKFLMNVNGNKHDIMDYILMAHAPARMIYVGDGANDAKALAKADISIATYNAKQPAVEIARFRLPTPDLYQAAEIIRQN